MKRILTAALCLMLLAALALPGVLAESAGAWYVVDSDSPRGYCYLYSKASDRDGISRNLGRYDNGEYVLVLDYYGGRDGKYNYCYVQTQDGKYGYMHDYSLTRYYGNVWADSAPGWFLVASREPQGYCYLYSEPSSLDGVGYNKGRHDNGEMVYVLEYYGGNGYCFVRTEEGETGYIGASALMRISDILADPTTGWYMVASSKRSYCYLYSKASSMDNISRNLGRYDNGEWVYVVDYEGENGYCFVFTQDGKTGFMAKSALEKY